VRFRAVRSSRQVSLDEAEHFPAQSRSPIRFRTAAEMLEKYMRAFARLAN
jgi:hypothetical protein